jgi:hypothetical protein
MKKETPEFDDYAIKLSKILSVVAAIIVVVCLTIDYLYNG